MDQPDPSETTADGAEVVSLDETRPPGVFARLVNEVRGRPFFYGVFFAFVAAGPIVVHFLFEGVPLGVGIIGGIAFGAYAAMCAVPQKFL